MNKLKTSERGIELLTEHEGFRPVMYKDSAGLPTIGYGTLIDTAEEQYLMTANISKEQGKQLLKRDVAKFERTINGAIKVAINQNQFDALLSFVYNVGSGNFLRSTLLKLINANAPKERIVVEFKKWKRAGGRILKGIVKRRAQEALLFISETVKKKELQHSQSLS